MAAAIAHADANNYSFGAKLVRGAYVEAERKRWEINGSVGDVPVWSNKQETDDCYDSCALMLEKRIAEEVIEAKKGKAGTGAFYASHNGTSVRKVLAALKDAGLVTATDKGLEIDARIRGRVSFAQLLGKFGPFSPLELGLTSLDPDRNE
jgi:proline dehydrogenase